MIDTEEKFLVSIKAAGLGLIPNNISHDLLRRLKFERIFYDLIGCKVFTLICYIRSTANFSVDGKLGEVGFCEVFRGKIVDSTNGRTFFFAIKLMSSSFSMTDGSR